MMETAGFPVGAFVSDFSHEFGVWDETDTRASIAGCRNVHGPLAGEVLTVAREAGDEAVYLGLFSLLGDESPMKATFVAKITPEHAVQLGRKLVDLGNQ